MSFETGDVEQEQGGAPGGGFTVGNPVGSFVETVGRVVAHPIDFFSGLLRRGDYLNPLIFAVIVYEISAILTGVINVATGSTGIGGFILTLILAPIIAAIVLFIWAGILHLLVMLFVGSANSGYESTFRVWAYSSVTGLVTWIPIIGPIVGGIYSVVLSILGIREMHETTTGRAALVVLIPTIVILVIAVVIVAIVIAIVASSLSSQ